VRADGFGGAPDIGQVRFAMVVERGRNADDNGVHRPQFGEICCGFEVSVAEGVRDFNFGNVLDVGLSLLEPCDLGPVNVKACG
jgi:coenzyme PQQ precursor peptide PqqA